MDLPPDEAQPQGFNSQPPEGGWKCRPKLHPTTRVSTHSRPKAAGLILRVIHWVYMSFNSQPPEGGWTAQRQLALNQKGVSTHSRPKAAGKQVGNAEVSTNVSTHSRPKAAGSAVDYPSKGLKNVSTHSRPKAAGNIQRDT